MLTTAGSIATHMVIELYHRQTASFCFRSLWVPLCNT